MAAWDPQPYVPVKRPEKARSAGTACTGGTGSSCRRAGGAGADELCPADGPEPLRYVGEVFSTYILAERGDELCLIDKHAAHERQLYEKLAANYGNVPSQMCWSRLPSTCLRRKNRPCWIHVPLLENAGLEIADFGGNTVVLRAVPGRCGAAERRKPAH